MNPRPLALLSVLVLALAGCDLVALLDDDAPSDAAKPALVFDDSTQTADDFPTDLYTIRSAEVRGDVVRLEATISGCDRVDANLVVSDAWMESEPVQAQAWLNFEPQDCDGIFQQRFRFDLSRVKAAYQQAYQTRTGTLVLRIGHKRGEDVSVRYVF